ncbi:GAF and ANTAR domain-containing protein [Microlunatus flavus]|uniref:GAF domain-containing protein n=1 Tax=Microlunatus flavus TaxID=1036181 RepID=A0A1H9G5F4_9ACTN|nr:GAF and ANTAR domain-containing protein [Microlunatus flavus]SEQ45357.1 GAF domain-containing protein [Microlunatus flavus]
MTDGTPPENPLLHRLQSLLLDPRDLGSTINELTQLAASLVPDAGVECGITLRVEGDVLTVGSSADRAVRLDETQYRVRGGPCIETLRTGLVVDVPDTAGESRWPEYVPTARALGLRCSLSLPLGTADETFGAMNVYGFARPRLFDDPLRHQLELFAAQASGTLRIIRRLTRDTRLIDQMEEALRSRTVIDQAMGIIMGQQRCTAATAFELLRRESQTSHRRVSEVATDLVRGTTGEDPAPGRGFGRT